MAIVSDVKDAEAPPTPPLGTIDLMVDERWVAYALAQLCGGDSRRVTLTLKAPFKMRYRSPAGNLVESDMFVLTGNYEQLRAGGCEVDLLGVTSLLSSLPSRSLLVAMGISWLRVFTGKRDQSSVSILEPTGQVSTIKCSRADDLWCRVVPFIISGWKNVYTKGLDPKTSVWPWGVKPSLVETSPR
uniref:Uncharacterized protein n=1 Tax=uncultured eukaryote TaxID=100272 RepID=K7ZV07_9EUKA|nr:hypothetical protein [uncultured eukaryote]